MAAINDLLKQVQDSVLRKRLEEEITHLSKSKKFGLVFEDHIPECSRLYGVGVKQGSLVTRRADTRLDSVWQVVQIEGEEAVCCKKGETTAVCIPVSDLVVVAQFGEPVYPNLEPVDAVCNAPDSDLWHTLIEADNYHALQLLEYLYAGQVDCIYIDPPYNTGARDWKYNNDYVDSSDSYRHSKWLSMMKKRLELAKKLLNHKDSVLIVTIDEKEYLHLGCLLEEMFPEAQMQMISITINPSGAIRNQKISRADEYAFILFFGKAHVTQMRGDGEETEVRWWYLRRLEYGSRRGTVKGGIAQFYPIYIDNKTEKIVKIGSPLPHTQDRHTVPEIVGTTTVFPIRDDGVEMNWGVTRETLEKLISQQVVRVSKNTNSKYQPYTIKYLSENYLEKIKSGRWAVKGYREDGTKIIVETSGKITRATTVWRDARYDAKTYGTVLLKGIIGNARFSFPKSLYSVEDTLKYFLVDKPNALILDFFAGSGTTLHAVNLLNAEDGGHRRCIMVTNNEVSSDEEKTLRSQGWQPGDEAWEQYGIARYVTWPRVVCSIEGHDINGHPLKGNYLGSDRPMAEGFAANCEYFKLGFMDKTRVSLGAQFREILPLLWLKTGAVGKRPELTGDDVPDMMILPENGFAVLIDETQFASFVSALRNTGIDKVFFVTNSESAFREMSEAVEARQTWQLYKDYIDNFTIGARRATQ